MGSACWCNCSGVKHNTEGLGSAEAAAGREGGGNRPELNLHVML